MKKALSTPVIVSVVTLAVALAIFFILRAGSGAAEFKAPPITGRTPDYIKEKMSPKQRAEVEKIEREQGLADKDAQMQQAQPQQNPYGGGG